MGRFDNKTAIVTGGVSGIGEAVTRAFLREGANVVVNCLPGEEAGKKMAAELSGETTAFALVEGDISKPEIAQKLVQTAIDQFGKADIFVSNAAAFDYYTPLLDTELSTWQKAVDVNLTGNYYISKAILPHMIENGGGAIIFVASIAGVIAGHGGAAYTTTKHGLVGLCKQITFDYGKHGIRCNTVCPGSTYTPLSAKFLDMPAAKEKLARTPYGTYGMPENIADPILFLASDEAKFIYGTTLLADGGNVVRKWD